MTFVTESMIERRAVETEAALDAQARWLFSHDIADMRFAREQSRIRCLELLNNLWAHYAACSPHPPSSPAHMLIDGQNQTRDILKAGS